MTDPLELSDQDLLRYSRQILLPQFGIEAQERLLNAHVLIIGAGGLGSPVALYLAAAGVGHISICDFDRVELSNLQRQIAHTQQDIGRPKVESAREAMLSVNPDIQVTAIDQKLAEQELDTLLTKVDLVIDGSDNFTTRFMVNRASVRSKTPLVSGAVIRMEGQVAVFRPDQTDSNPPCYQCLYPDGEELDETCSRNGVLAPVVGIIGSIQATEAIKVISQTGHALNGRLLIMDADTMQFRNLNIRKDRACPVCGSAQPNG